MSLETVLSQETPHGGVTNLQSQAIAALVTPG